MTAPEHGHGGRGFQDGPVLGPWGWGLKGVVLMMLAAILVLVASSPWSEARTRSVVLYASQDQNYVEPILRDFEAQTGIRVLAVYDSEAAKTVGLVNRLLAERGLPQCDVFWNSEILRMHQLADRQVFRAAGGWKEFGYRSRRLVVNTNLLSVAAAPRSWGDLTNAQWRGKVALAYPLFGTAATHFLALRQAWGDVRWRAWCRALVANQPLIVDGNSVVVKLVGSGEAWLGLTDSDDIAAGQRERLPVAALPWAAESLLIPNAVGVIRDAPHPAAAQMLFEYIQSQPVLERLIAAHALEGKVASVAGAATLRPDWRGVLRELEASTISLKEMFLR